MRPSTSTSNALSVSQLFIVNANWVGISFMWNALHPILLPAMLLGLVPNAKKNTYLGLLTFAGLVIAMIIQPLSGSLSDSWKSRYGRRRPLMAAATILDCVFLLVLGSSGGLVWLCIGYIGLQVCSNAAQGPLQGLLRDRVPSGQLAVASSLKILLDLLSLVLAGLVAGHLLGSGRNPAMVMLLIAVLLLTSAAITIRFTPEKPSQSFAEDRSENPPDDSARPLGWQAGYRALISERALFLLGIYGLQAFGQYYLGDVLRVQDPARQAGNLLASVGAGTVILVGAGGWLIGRLGAKRILYLASGLTGIGLLLLVWVTQINGVLAFGGLIGAGIGLFLTSNWTLANRLAPEAQAGKFLGLTNLATAGAAAVARLQGPAVDLLNSARPGDWIGYRGIFLFGAICVLASAVFVTRVKAAS